MCERERQLENVYRLYLWSWSWHPEEEDSILDNTPSNSVNTILSLINWFFFQAIQYHQPYILQSLILPRISFVHQRSHLLRHIHQM